MKEMNIIMPTCQNQNIKYYNQIFLSKSILRRSKLSVCELNLVEDKTIKLNIIKNHRNSSCQLPINIINKRQPFNQKTYKNNNNKPNNKQETIQSSQRQNQDQQPQINIINSYKSEQKLPSLSKYALELNLSQNPNNLIRIVKEPTKPKLNNKFFRQVSQKNSVIRIKPPDEEKQINQLQPNAKQEKKKLKERQYLLKKIMLGSEIQNKQKGNINILMSKLRQTERRGRLSVNFLERKVERSPSQLTANKFQFEQIGKSNIKQQIMKKFSLQLGINTKKKEITSQNTSPKQQNYVSAWHVQGQNNLLDQNQQFI